MKRVFVSAAYNAPNAWLVEQNVRAAEALGFEVAKLGGCAIVPHTMCRFLQGTIDEDYWIAACLCMLDGCDAALFAPNWSQSIGARRERRHATATRIPCFDTLPDLKVWLRKASNASDAHQPRIRTYADRITDLGGNHGRVGGTDCGRRA